VPVVSVGDGTCRMQTLRLQTGTLSPISLTRMGSSPAQAEAIPYLVDLVAREPMPEKFFELITESVRILREKNAFCSLGFSQPSCPKDRPKDHGEKSLEQRSRLDSPKCKLPVDCSSTRTPILWSMLHGSSILASRREERVQKAVSVDHHGPGDSGQSHEC